MKVITSLDLQLWKNFVEDNPHGNIFHTPEMYQVFSRAKGYQPSIWATVENGNILALFMPVQIGLWGGPLKIFTTRAVAYGSVLATNGRIGHEALKLLLKTYNQRVSVWPSFTELRNLSDLSEIQGVLIQNGYAHEGHLNYLIDIQRAPEAIMASFNEDARRRIRRAMKRGEITIKEITDRAQLSTFYSILKKTYQYVHVPLADISLFEAAFDVLFPQKMIRITLAYIDDVPVTASATLLYKDVLYGWYNGTNRDYRSYGPNEYEVWELINWGIEHNYRTLDFGGAGKPDEEYGVRDFKAKFNGKLVNFGRNSHIHAPLRLKISKLSYGLAKNAMQTFQNLGPKITPKQKPAETP